MGSPFPRLTSPPPAGHGSEAPCGFLVLDKPAGLTSHDCVARVRRSYHLRRVGHGGTLDPAVTGVLPIAVGAATRLLPYLPGEKSYRGVVQLGVRTTTDDLEGEVLERAPLPPLNVAAVEAALAAFRGGIRQRPPRVSAVHVGGERAYVRARRGEQPELEAREVTLHELRLEAFNPASGRVELSLRCSAGTYVRALARDLGEALGCGGALAGLRRTRALGFGLQRAVTLEALATEPPPPLLDPLEALSHLPQLRLAQEQLPAWRCGRAVAAPDGRVQEAAAEQPVVVLRPDGILAGMARIGPQGLLHPKLVFDAAG